ncbi:putative MLH3 protein [Thozetella sp. PMI_491]|nr:putative MLH3 protein [Thozetella sp. PMI_491]
MSIKPLPGDVVARIKSSVVLTSLNVVIHGLVKNALDAGASKINISVDYSRGNCSVEDNGVGIPPADFHEDGGLGKLHYTSRYPPQEDVHGRNGDFIASLGTLSLLAIASHHKEYHSHNYLAIHNSKVVARDLPAHPEQMFLAFSSGTRVTVRDLFGFMPVRVKHRAQEAERVGFSKDFDRLVAEVAALLISWHGAANVSLRDVGTKKTISLRAPASLSKHDVQGNLAEDLLCRAPRLLVQASLCDAGDLDSWVAIGASAPGVTIRGCVSRLPVATKRIQFIALGIKPLSNEHRSNVLFEEMNQTFANSSFGIAEEIVQVRAEEGLRANESHAVTEMRLRKGVDKWPMFFLQVSLDQPQSGLDWDIDALLDDRHQSLAAVTSLIQAMAHEFLKKYHFQPRPANAFQQLRVQAASTAEESGWDTTPSSQVRRPRASQQIVPRARLSTRARNLRSSSAALSARDQSERRAGSPFDMWSRVKSSGPIRPPPKSQETDAVAINGEDLDGMQTHGDTPPSSGHFAPTRRWIDKNGVLFRKPFDVDDALHSANAPADVPEGTAAGDIDPNTIPETDAESTTAWIDPVTKVRFLVDTRTGFIKQGNNLVAEKRLSFRHPKDRKEAEEPETAPWLKDLLSTWKNPVFEPTEPQIERVPDVYSSLGFGECAGNDRIPGSSTGLTFGGAGEASSKALWGKISRQGLKLAEVVAQVDEKFILVKVPWEPDRPSEVGQDRTGYLLVLVDQHAADERCRVEELIENYFALDKGTWKARTESPGKPLRFDVTKQEGDLLIRFRSHFERWGISYEIFAVNYRSEQSRKPVVKVDIQSLPPSILERCRAEPRLLIDLLRKEAWSLHDEPRSTISKENEVDCGSDSNRDWVSRFHGCPQGILDLINSRSCRSAIMFNDPLSLEECRVLLQRLTKCAFPFQCAHGRPSMVPAVHIGPDKKTNPTFDYEQPDQDFGERLRAWAKAKKR